MGLMFTNIKIYLYVLFIVKILPKYLKKLFEEECKWKRKKQVCSFHSNWLLHELWIVQMQAIKRSSPWENAWLTPQFIEDISSPQSRWSLNRSPYFDSRTLLSLIIFEKFAYIYVHNWYFIEMNNNIDLIIIYIYFIIF